MKRIYSAQDSLLLNHLRNVLESAGIACEIRNDVLSGAAGELPLTECWPELWVSDSLLAPEAERLVKEALGAEDGGNPQWTCPSCGEQVEPQFSQCWQCGTPRPGD